MVVSVASVNVLKMALYRRAFLVITPIAIGTASQNKLLKLEGMSPLPCRWIMEKESSCRSLSHSLRAFNRSKRKK